MVRKVGGRLLVMSLGLIVAFGLIEIGGRLVMGFKPPPGWAQNFYDRVGYELHPDTSYTYVSKSGEFEIEVKLNHRGLHDVEHSLHKPDGVFRILILSDSYGQSREVPLETNFARQLEGVLNSAAPTGLRYEVINAGYAGLGTTQEYLYYTTEGRQYDPDLVLLGFYVGNDVMDNYGPLIKAWDGVDHVNFPTFSIDGSLRQPGMAIRRRLPTWIHQNSYLVHTIWDVLNGPADADRIEVGDPNGESQIDLHVPMGIYLPADETWQNAWNVTEIALRHLKTAVENDGAKLGVFVIPDRRQIYDENWNATLARLPDLDPDNLDRERPTNTVLALLDTVGIPRLSLLEPFRATQKRLYFEVDGHFNAAGHTLAARALAQWLSDSQLILGAER